jgi:DNA-binding XRE family transcriptional regulator
MVVETDERRSVDAPEDQDTRLLGADYSERLGVLVFKFLSGKIYAIPLADFETADGTAVSKITILPDGDAAIVEQGSGNILEIPWDVVLYHAEPAYPYYKNRRDQQNDQSASRIGQRIRDERTARGWTLAVLESKTGIKVPNLSRVEKGKHRPSLETLEKIADAFGVPVVELIATRR